jgi:antirestriction protein ArdC
VIQSPSSTEIIIGALVALLEKGCIPWRHSWRCRGLGLQQRNLITGHLYGGADSIVLAIAMLNQGAPLPLWCTYPEARAGGLAPRRGSKGVHLGLAPSGLNRSQHQGCVFNVADLVGPTYQHMLAKRRRALRASRQDEGQSLQRAENLFKTWQQELFLAAEDPIRVGREDGALGDGHQKPRNAFLHELAWSMLAERIGMDRDCGVFVLAEADWIQLLRASPQTFFELLTEANNAVDRLDLENRVEGKC